MTKGDRKFSLEKIFIVKCRGLEIRPMAIIQTDSTFSSYTLQSRLVW